MTSWPLRIVAVLIMATALVGGTGVAANAGKLCMNVYLWEPLSDLRVCLPTN